MEVKDTLTEDNLITLGVNKQRAQEIIHAFNNTILELPPEKAWHKLSKELLKTTDPFAIHLYLYHYFYRYQKPDYPGPAWFPEATHIEQSNLMSLMRELKLSNFEKFQQWSHSDYREFWQLMIARLGIVFNEDYSDICDISAGKEHPQWLVDATLNIANSCFNANPNKVAIIAEDPQGQTLRVTYGELEILSNRVANGLQALACQPGTTIAVNMPMTIEAVAVYLGIIKAGCQVVSIADSFSAPEIATRLQITHCELMFTQDVFFRNGKAHPLYQKVIAAETKRVIVIPANNNTKIDLRKGDILWKDFLSDTKQYNAISCEPNSIINILFSSGTTGVPKAIPWTHSTPIKCASDACLHHNISADDILAWPTSLGWMMGPWLVFAALINQACMALYYDAPLSRSFGEFVERNRVTMLGVIPSLVSHWRASRCMEGLNWQAIKAFSSTGECSNAEDMLYLMHLAGYKPIIEYCGGTEIGGAYISSTLLQPNIPSTFSTATCGLDFVLLDAEQHVSHNGEVAIIPPSIGLSTSLLNADHHQIYYANMPKLADDITLRRHGDQIERLTNGYYVALGRVDDTMKLGGIKISATEIERALLTLTEIKECAAIAVNEKQGGPAKLIIYLVPQNLQLELDQLRGKMQVCIRDMLNPLFKIHDVVLIEQLPRTASNKVMRRELRSLYSENNA